MVAVDRAHEHNGALNVLKGSHKLGRLDHARESTAGEVKHTDARTRTRTRMHTHTVVSMDVPLTHPVSSILLRSFILPRASSTVDATGAGTKRDVCESRARGAGRASVRTGCVRAGAG
jgi:hypothetical protein